MTVLAQPPYSLDLVPPDIFLFPKLKSLPKDEDKTEIAIGTTEDSGRCIVYMLAEMEASLGEGCDRAGEVLSRG